MGAVWLGCYPDESRMNLIKEQLNIPDYILPISLVALGYAESKEKKTRAIDKDKVHHNIW